MGGQTDERYWVHSPRLTWLQHSDSLRFSCFSIMDSFYFGKNTRTYGHGWLAYFMTLQVGALRVKVRNSYYTSPSDDLTCDWWQFDQCPFYKRTAIKHSISFTPTSKALTSKDYWRRTRQGGIFNISVHNSLLRTFRYYVTRFIQTGTIHAIVKWFPSNGGYAFMVS